MAAEDGSVETEAEFEAALESEGILDLLMGSAPDEPAVEPDVDTGSAVERPRDPETGRFVAQDQEAEDTPAAENEVAPEAAPEPEDDEDIVIEIDDDLQAVLERYDGDVGKALRALGEKETMVGRQANEVGEMRAQLAEMRQLMEQGFQQIPQQPQYFGPYQNDLEDNPKGLVYEALQRGDGQTMEIAIRAWGEEEPFEAATFLFSLQQQQQAQAVQEPAPVPAPQAVGQSLETAMADVVNRHPDVERYLPGLGETAKEFPTLRNFMESGTPAQKAQAFEELLVITKARSSQTDTSQAMKRVILKAKEEAHKERTDAAVVSAQTQSAATARQTGMDAFYELFDEATERYSTADWITRSND